VPDGVTLRAMADKPCILFVCTHNAARSQIGEALLRKHAGHRFRAWSAGVKPAGVHPMTKRVLEEIGVDTTRLRSKNVREVLGRVSVKTAIVVCAKAAESCPHIFPGALQVLQWPFDDPVAVHGSEDLQLAAFRRTREAIDMRIREWLRSN
jgi:arsenate reductase (thioredoxin)